MSTWSGTSYVSDLIVKKTSLGLRSDNQHELDVPRTHLVTYRDRAFSAAANQWNSITVAIRLCNTVTTFKSCIKTYLFNRAYPINQWFYQIRNILCCWEGLLVQCDSYGYVFLSYVFYSLFSTFEYCRRSATYIWHYIWYYSNRCVVDWKFNRKWV